MEEQQKTLNAQHLTPILAEDPAFLTFAEKSPHECFIAWPERFIAYARKKEPTATTAQIIARLRETAENSAVEGLVDTTTKEMRAPAL